MHYRTGNVGLQAQWLEAWWPASDDEFAFVVEDDLEVSPLYYEFVKTLIVNFYYNGSNYSPSIFGATLQRARFVPGTILLYFVSKCSGLVAIVGVVNYSVIFSYKQSRVLVAILSIVENEVICD